MLTCFVHLERKSRHSKISRSLLSTNGETFGVHFHRSVGATTDNHWLLQLTRKQQLSYLLVSRILAYRYFLLFSGDHLSKTHIWNKNVYIRALMPILMWYNEWAQSTLNDFQRNQIKTMYYATIIIVILTITANLKENSESFLPFYCLLWL